MDRTEPRVATSDVVARAWELLGTDFDRHPPPQTRALIARVVTRLIESTANLLTSGEEVPDDLISEMRELGLALSRWISWDAIDDINNAAIRSLVESSGRLGGADVGEVCEVALTVSNHFYDGFWAYNNRDGFEQALRLGSLIDHFPIPTFMLDEAGGITFANGELCRVLSENLGDLEARKLEDFLVSKEPILESSESPVRIVNDASGERHYTLTLSRIESSTGVEFFGLLVDRTDEVNLERTKEQVIATISHELRTPLTAVVGYAELLADGSQGEVDRAEATSVIHEQAQHLLELVADLVDFARLDTGSIGLKLAEIDLRAAVDAAIRRVNVGEPVELKIRIPHRVFLLADRVRMEQLFTNLITNAVRYGGSQITVDAWMLSESSVGVRFADNGPGIASIDRAHVFDSFYQGESTYIGTGTGMGLAICQAIVRAHNGSIVLEERPGASFLVELPAAVFPV